jgi:hypothetical protein
MAASHTSKKVFIFDLNDFSKIEEFGVQGVPSLIKFFPDSRRFAVADDE